MESPAANDVTATQPFFTSPDSAERQLHFGDAAKDALHEEVPRDHSAPELIGEIVALLALHDAV
jgi:hypothetical protein